TWGPSEEHELLQEGWQELRDNFRLLNNREGWKPRPREKETFEGTKVAYRLDFAKDLWEKEANPAIFDEENAGKVSVELLLRAYEPTEDEETGRKRVIKHASKGVTAVVLVLPKMAKDVSAAKVALDYLEDKKKREG